MVALYLTLLGDLYGFWEGFLLWLNEVDLLCLNFMFSDYIEVRISPFSVYRLIVLVGKSGDANNISI